MNEYILKSVESLDFFVDNNNMLIFKIYQNEEIEQKLVEKLK